jgi:hypothetical protein
VVVDVSTTGRDRALASRVLPLLPMTTTQAIASPTVISRAELASVGGGYGEYAGQYPQDPSQLASQGYGYADQQVPAGYASESSQGMGGMFGGVLSNLLQSVTSGFGYSFGGGLGGSLAQLVTGLFTGQR